MEVKAAGTSVEFIPILISTFRRPDRLKLKLHFRQLSPDVQQFFALALLLSISNLCPSMFSPPALMFPFSMSVDQDYMLIGRCCC